jgi:hypothetical protein
VYRDLNRVRVGGARLLLGRAEPLRALVVLWGGGAGGRALVCSRRGP